mmetsp:Transcript_47181/g.102699  ORF Transcript_47181/g.102699 Transcript_47181/m.102699 type:complete len:765 (+) Transcript_47181:24-2318(+)
MAPPVLPPELSEKVVIHDFGGDVGLQFKATKPIQQSEIWLTIPWGACWTGEMALASLEKEVSLGDAKINLLDAFAASLSVFRKKDHELLRCIPGQVNSVLHWTPGELDLLEGNASVLAAAKVEASRNGYASLPSKAQKAVQPKDFTWGSALATACCLDGHHLEEDGPVLVPWLYYAAHDPSLPTLGSVQRDGDAVVVRALRDYKEGEPVGISWGAWSNAALLINKGYTIPEGTPWDGVDITYTVDNCAEILNELLLCAPDAPEDPSTSRFQFVEVPTKEEVKEHQAAFVVRLTLSMEELEAFETARPAPPAKRSAFTALLGISRLQRMPFEALNSEHFASGKPAPNVGAELSALAGLQAAFAALMGQHTRSLEEDDATVADPSVPAPKRHAAVVGAAEKAILVKAAAVVDKLLDEGLSRALKALPRGKDGQDPRVDGGGSVWRSWLTERGGALLEKKQAALDRFRYFTQLPLASSGARSAASLVQVAQACFAWLHGVDLDTGAALLLPERAGCRGPASGVVQELQNGQTAYLDVYLSKMTMWGAYLLSHLAECGTIPVDDMNTMAQEQISIASGRSSAGGAAFNIGSWSVPTRSAIEVMKKLGPLQEIGAGTGTWAKELSDAGVDIAAFDTLKFSRALNPHLQMTAGQELVGARWEKIQEGGVEKIKAGRNLVLMWPDIEGQGRFGVQCVGKAAELKVEHLILVGEWSGSTYGDSIPHLPRHGQSFSLECQKAVEEAYTLVETVALPSWPLFKDRLAVWKLKGA